MPSLNEYAPRGLQYLSSFTMGPYQTFGVCQDSRLRFVIVGRDETIGDYREYLAIDPATGVMTLQGYTGGGTPGPAGPAGPEGPQGPAGQATVIVGSFGATRTPAELPVDGLIPADWDGPGAPTAPYQMTLGQSLIYTGDGHLWQFVEAAVPAGWVDIGLVQGPPGPQGVEGPAGPAGPQGPVGTNLLAVAYGNEVAFTAIGQTFDLFNASVVNPNTGNRWWRMTAVLACRSSVPVTLNVVLEGASRSYYGTFTPAEGIYTSAQVISLVYQRSGGTQATRLTARLIAGAATTAIFGSNSPAPQNWLRASYVVEDLGAAA